MRPLWSEFPEDTGCFTEQDAFLLGPALLVKPVTKEGIVTTDIRFPGNNDQLWYDVITYQSYNGGQSVSLDTPLDKIAVLQRGGTVVPRKNRLRRSASQMAKDPFTLIIALDKNQNAHGEIYIDDGDSFDFKTGGYVYQALSFSKNQNGYVLRSSKLAGKFDVTNKIERIVIVGLPQKPSNVKSSQNSLSFDYTPNAVLTVKNPNVVVSEDWSIDLIN